MREFDRPTNGLRAGPPLSAAATIGVRWSPMVERDNTEAVIYTKPWCGFCTRAIAVLERYGIPYEEIDVRADPAREEEMNRRSGGRYTVPQIFLRGVHVGGSDELIRLARDGGLDEYSREPVEDGP